MGLVSLHLAMPVTVVQPGFFNGGVKVREQSDRAGGGCGRGVLR